MNKSEIEAGASAIIDIIRGATTVHGISERDAMAMSALAIVEIVGQAAGPIGAAKFFRDLADQIEADHVQRLT